MPQVSYDTPGIEREQPMSTARTEFLNRDAAAKAMGSLFASGAIVEWSCKPSTNGVMVRFQAPGERWRDLTDADMAAFFPAPAPIVGAKLAATSPAANPIAAAVWKRDGVLTLCQVDDGRDFARRWAIPLITATGFDRSGIMAAAIRTARHWREAGHREPWSVLMSWALRGAWKAAHGDRKRLAVAAMLAAPAAPSRSVAA